MNIVTLSNSPLEPSLGSGRTVLSFTDGLIKAGHTVKLMGPDSLSRGKGKGAMLRLGYGALDVIKKNIKISDIDLFELYGGEFWPVVNWIKKQSNRPLVISHSNGFELLDIKQKLLYSHKNTFAKAFKDAFRKKFIRNTFKYSDYLVFLSKADGAYALNEGIGEKSRIVIVPPGLNIEFLNRSLLKDQSHSVGFIGSWSDRKNPKCVVKVFASLADTDSKLTFELFGTRLKPEVVKSYFPSRIHNRLTVHEHLNDKDISEKLSRVKVFLSPSWYEGFGLGIAEAMACGAAVVSTPTGFACELLRDEEVKIVNFGSDEEMTKVTLDLLSNDSERQKIRINGLKRIQNLRWELSTKILVEHYEEWVKKR